MTAGAWRGLRGWRFFLALLAGAVAALALPPAHGLPVLAISLPLLLALLSKSSGAGRAFALGWAFGFGFFAASLYWIGFALLVEPGRLAWLLPAAALGLPAVLAVYWGLAAAAWRWLLGRRWGTGLGPGGQAGLLAAVLTVVEVARGHLFTGFPWNLPGYAVMGYPWPMQGAALVGAYGLTLAVLLAALAPYPLIAGGPWPRRLVRAGLLALPLVALTGYGAQRLPESPAARTDTVLRLVQANIPQHEKWDPDLAGRNLARHIALSQGSAPRDHTGRLLRRGDGLSAPVDAVIWPEAATYLDLSAGSAARTRIGRRLPHDLPLLTGVTRRVQRQDGGTQYFNSLQALSVDPGAGPLATYDKAHLVPFGEYVPFRTVLPVETVVPGLPDMTPGPGPRRLAPADLPAFSPLICYEVIFPGAVTPPGERPAWLLNVTNDAWYGATAGPYQHRAQAALRALETGLPLVRAANTGISSLVGPYGREAARLPLNATGLMDVRLPEALPAPPFARWGAAGWAGLLVVTVVFASLDRSRFRLSWRRR